LDIFTVVQRGLATVDELWGAWTGKNPGKPASEAKVNVLRRLEELEARRPLTAIDDVGSREDAARVRTWTRCELCREQPT
jgi:hypothetical protein